MEGTGDGHVVAVYYSITEAVEGLTQQEVVWQYWAS